MYGIHTVRKKSVYLSRKDIRIFKRILKKGIKVSYEVINNSKLSTGKCVFVSENNTNILVEAGISKKKIEEGLNENDVNLSDIDAIFITHEHIDHVKDSGWLAEI